MDVGCEAVGGLAVPSKSGQNGCNNFAHNKRSATRRPLKVGSKPPIRQKVGRYEDTRRPLKVGSKPTHHLLLQLPPRTRRPLKVGSKRGGGMTQSGGCMLAVPSKSGQNGDLAFRPLNCPLHSPSPQSRVKTHDIDDGQ